LSDLLPPSPSAVANSRIFTPSPSHLNSSMTSNPLLPPTHSTFKDANSLFSWGLPRTNSPPSFDLRSAPVDTSSSMYPQQPRAHSHNPSSSLASISSLPSSSVLPVLRPLDFSVLGSEESTQIELARTIDDLSKCLSVVETGLTSMLEAVYTNTIEEEQEE
ncbi:hypothetical protein GYMLUDRAFT_105998, partial [Collybiopsis luxurians FD-317 M1]